MKQMRSLYAAGLVMILLLISLFAGCAQADPQETEPAVTTVPTTEPTYQETEDTKEPEATAAETTEGTVPETTEATTPENTGAADPSQSGETPPAMQQPPASTEGASAPPATDPLPTEPPATEPPVTEPPVTAPPENHPAVPPEATVPSAEPPITEPAPTEHQHSYNAVVTNPTCYEGGYTTYTCPCGDSYVGDTTEATGHTWKLIYHEATGTKEYFGYICPCGAPYKTFDELHEHQMQYTGADILVHGGWAGADLWVGGDPPRAEHVCTICGEVEILF